MNKLFCIIIITAVCIIPIPKNASALRPQAARYNPPSISPSEEEVLEAVKEIEGFIKIHQQFFMKLGQVLLDERKRVNELWEEYKDKLGEDGLELDEVTTKTDHYIQARLTEKILTMFPTHRIVAEEEFPLEFQHINEANKDSPFVWVIDPIDGAAQFINPKSKNYCIAVALLYKGIPVASFIMAPEYEYRRHKGMLVTAIRGKGVFVNGKPIEISKIQKPERAFVFSELPASEQKYLFSEDVYDALSKRFNVIKTAATSTVLDIIKVLLGEAEFLIYPRIKLWDALPAAIPAELQGGFVFYPDDNKIFPIDNSIFNQPSPQLLPKPLVVTFSKQAKEFIVGLARSTNDPETLQGSRINSKDEGVDRLPSSPKEQNVLFVIIDAAA